MTKKHFEAIAAVLRAEIVFSDGVRDDNDNGIVERAVLRIADEFASLFAQYNAGFNRDKFIKAVKGE